MAFRNQGPRTGRPSARCGDRTEQATNSARRDLSVVGDTSRSQYCAVDVLRCTPCGTNLFGWPCVWRTLCRHWDSGCAAATFGILFTPPARGQGAHTLPLRLGLEAWWISRGDDPGQAGACAGCRTPPGRDDHAPLKTPSRKKHSRIDVGGISGGRCLVLRASPFPSPAPGRRLTGGPSAPRPRPPEPANRAAHSTPNHRDGQATEM